MVPACDDFEICLELELTKKAPQGSKVTQPVDWYFLMGPHFFIALVDSPGSRRRPLSLAETPVFCPTGAEWREQMPVTLNTRSLVLPANLRTHSPSCPGTHGWG